MLTGVHGPLEDKLALPFLWRTLQRNILSLVTQPIRNRVHMSLIPAEGFLVRGVDFVILIWVFVHTCKMVTEKLGEISIRATYRGIFRLLACSWRSSVTRVI